MMSFVRKLLQRIFGKRKHEKCDALEPSQYRAFLKNLEEQVASRLEKCECPREDIAQFEIVGKLAEGAFGIVVKALHLVDDVEYAIKIQLKRSVVSQERVEYVIREKVIQYAAASEFVVALKFVYQNPTWLYMMMEYSPYGDFARCFLCNKRWTATEEKVKLYAAQVVLGLEFLHINHITHRDLKPPNCVVFPGAYLKLGDFGFAKASGKRMFSIVGSEPYIAPEVMLGRGYGSAVDWYALGVMVSEALHDNNIRYVAIKHQITQNEAQARIKKKGYNKVSKKAEDFIRQLQKISPSERLGNLTGEADDVKLHPWFKSLNFSCVFEKHYDIEIPCEKIDPVPIDFDSDFWKAVGNDEYTDDIKDL